MSGSPQKRKGVYRKALFCGNGSKFNSRDEAKAYIQKLIDKGQRGAKTLKEFPCTTCSRRGQEVIHVGHRTRKQVANR